MLRNSQRGIVKNKPCQTNVASFSRWIRWKREMRCILTWVKLLTLSHVTFSSASSLLLLDCSDNLRSFPKIYYNVMSKIKYVQRKNYYKVHAQLAETACKEQLWMVLCCTGRASQVHLGLFNIFINYLNHWLDSPLIKSADDIKLGKDCTCFEGQTVLQFKMILIYWRNGLKPTKLMRGMEINIF